MKGLTVAGANGAYQLSGNIDENADFSGIAPASDGKLSLGFRGVRRINSAGAAKLVDFAHTWGRAHVEYWDLPSAIVDACIMLPSLLGTEDATAWIRSLGVPYKCGACQTEEFVITKVDAMHLSEGGAIAFPKHACSKCAGPMQPGRETEEYAALVDMGALKLGRKA